MKEMRQILSRARELRQRGESAVLATVVAVEGSAYRREGARMLIESDGRLTGVLSGGCLEQDLAERAAAVLASGNPALATYDLRAPDEILWGLGLGCGGKITLLLQPLSGATDAPSPLEPFERVARERRPGEIETRMGSELLLREAIVPPTRLVLAGAGRDAVPLARFADELGWETIVLDARPTAAAQERFAGLARVAPVGPRDFATAVTIDTYTAAVVLTHNYLDDLAWLAALLPSAAPYVGLLGPATRRDRLLADLADAGDGARRGDAVSSARPRRPRSRRPSARTGRARDRRRDPGGDDRRDRHRALASACGRGGRREPQRATTDRRPRAVTVAGVLLAAGSSRRMGRPKALLPYRGTTLLASGRRNAVRHGVQPSDRRRQPGE